MKTLRVAVLLLLFAGTAGCGDRDERLETWDGLAGPWSAGRTLSWLDRNFDEMLVIEPAADVRSPKWSRIPVPADAALVATLPGRKALLLQSKKNRELLQFSPETGALKSFAVASPYDRFQVDEERGMVLAFFSEHAQGDEGSLLLNKSEVAVIDLDATKDAVRKYVLPTLGGAPLGIDVAPSVKAGGKTRALAFVRWVSYVTFIDLNDKEAAHVSVQLKTGDNPANLAPGEMQFTTDGSVINAWFLVDGTIDLHLLRVDAANPEGLAEGSSLNLFSTAGGPEKFIPFTAADGKEALLVGCSWSRTAAVVYPDETRVDLFPLEIPPTGFYLFERPGEEGKPELDALIYDPSGTSAAYYFVELDRLKEKKSKAFHYYVLPAGVRSVYPLATADKFVVIHSQGGATPMAIVTASDGSVVSLGGNLSLSNEIFVPEGNLLYALTQSPSGWHVARIDLTQVSTVSVRVGDLFLPDALLELPDGGMLAVTDQYGDNLLLLPRDFKDASDAVLLSGPALIGIEH